ncbi:MAG TPA: dihydrodipicolinate synthase family protein [Lacipirellulaceae bacterium]|nr:dihydrodipicolinate synthase family protein [Lacipirellulaceae bacterium]
MISAIGTPLGKDESLHQEGLERLLETQWRAGINGVLVAGTMGLLQLLRDETYAELVEHSVNLCNGRGQLLVGVGDAGFARTADRIRYVNGFSVDGVVAITPYFIQFKQDELIDYYRALADISKAPLYLYDLPSMARAKLDVATVVELSKHPNIVGIKCSGDLSDTLELIRLVDDSFSVIVAQADRVDTLCKVGVANHLDGVFSLAPEWTRQIAAAAETVNWNRAAALQRQLTSLLMLLHEFGVFPAYNELMRARGIPGLFAPLPFRTLDESNREKLLGNEISEALQAFKQARTDPPHEGKPPLGVPTNGASTRSSKHSSRVNRQES